MMGHFPHSLPAKAVSVFESNPIHEACFIKMLAPALCYTAAPSLGCNWTVARHLCPRKHASSLASRTYCKCRNIHAAQSRNEVQPVPWTLNRGACQACHMYTRELPVLGSATTATSNHSAYLCFCAGVYRNNLMHARTTVSLTQIHESIQRAHRQATATQDPLALMRNREWCHSINPRARPIRSCSCVESAGCRTSAFLDRLQARQRACIVKLLCLACTPARMNAHTNADLPTQILQQLSCPNKKSGKLSRAPHTSIHPPTQPHNRPPASRLPSA